MTSRSEIARGHAGRAVHASAAIGRSRRRGVDPDGSTRHRILLLAAELFARQGYHATTTRQIAAAVGIRQPSLFHHFATKAAIVVALYEWDLGLAEPHVGAIAHDSAPAAVRLYRYLRWDVEHLMFADYDLSGIYGPDVIDMPDFAPWARRIGALIDLVEGIVRDGVASGEFIGVDPTLARQAIHGILDRVLFLHDASPERIPRLAEELTFLMVRGLLSDPLRIDEVLRLSAVETG